MNAQTRLNVTVQYIACLVMNELTLYNNLSILVDVSNNQM